MGSCPDTDIDPPLLPQRVPQRSILGPLLFFYINEMPGVISEDTSLPLFAEDSKCFHLVLRQDDGIKLQEDLNKLFVTHLRNEVQCQKAKVLRVACFVCIYKREYFLVKLN